MEKPGPTEYEVYNEDDGTVQVKTEPVDPSYDVEASQSKTTENDSVEDEGKKIRAILKHMVENQGKELTVKSVVENLLQQNELVLAQNDAHSKKPQQRTAKPKQQDHLATSHGCILTPSDPTNACNKEDMPNLNGALVELAVTEANNDNYEPDVICAVGSKIILMTPRGQPLQMDITYYWCNFCSFKAKGKEELLGHVMEHRFHCKYCKFQSFSRSSVIHHCAQEHETFQETAKTLKYCTYIPDILHHNEQNKRKETNAAGDAPSSKRKKLNDSSDEQPELNMEVDEIDDGMVQSMSVEKVIIPRSTSAEKEVTKPKAVVKQKPMPTTTNSNKSPANIQPGVAQVIPISGPISVSSLPVQQMEALPNLPVITSVMSGHLAVSAALANGQPQPLPELPKQPAIAPKPGPSAEKPPSKPSTSSGVTVSSGLCWNCGYCGFVTLSQSFLKIHLNHNHSGKAHKYVAMLVSSEEEMARIKASDANLVTNPTQSTIVGPLKHADFPAEQTSSSGRTTLPAPTPRDKLGAAGTPVVEIDNAETTKTPEDTEAEKIIPISFKCAHCNFSSVEVDRVRDHLFQRHAGGVIYALDMKAVKLRKKRYIFFCMNNKCKYSTKEVEEYSAHAESCTPWLDGRDVTGVETNLIKSLELTKTFIEKTAKGMDSVRDNRLERAAEYSCIYCSYVSNNNTRLKKHVLTNHSDKNTVIKDLQAAASNRRMLVHFCKFCLWETRQDDQLAVHVTERHPDKVQEQPTEQKVVTNENTAQSTPSPIPVITKTEPVDEATGSESSYAPSPAAAGSADDAADDNDENQSEEDNAENEYDGVVTKDQYDKAMSAYVDSENSQDRPKTSGRPTRNAALKCRMKVKAMKLPPLFKCQHCAHNAFGTKLMREHLRQKHKKLTLQAVDLLKQHKKIPNCVFFICPSEKCTFSSAFATDVVNHCKNNHGIPSTHQDLMRMSQVSTPPPAVSVRGRVATQATGESYECLYCNTSKTYHSRKDMKKHLIQDHTNEEFIYRDCVARKLKQRSRFYMCHNLTCDFTNEKQKDYLIHRLAHKNTKIYECNLCQWFTSTVAEVDSHKTDVHPGETVKVTEIDLALDSNKETVMLVAGTVIKTEK